jgi:hypothetical protein
MGTYYKNVEPWLEKIDHGAWVELGVDRGEGSTQWFANKAKTQADGFFGVDMDPVQIEKANHSLKSKTATLGANGQMEVVVGDLSDHIKLINAKGEDFLTEFATTSPDKKISLAYLDNFDWDYWLGREEEAFVVGVKQNYQDKMGVEMNNINSQLTHLLQAYRLIPLMTKNSVIICDDTWAMPEEGIFSGKCSAAIPFIMLHGYKIIHQAGYRQNSGVILGRFKQ